MVNALVDPFKRSADAKLGLFVECCNPRFIEQSTVADPERLLQNFPTLLNLEIMQGFKSELL